MTEKPGYLPTLDGWRCVAITAVLCCHIHWPSETLLRLAPNGALGVHLFFALSGFLITTRILEENLKYGRVSWANFYIRRCFRILPPALLYLAFAGAMGLWLGLIPMDWAQLRAAAFFYRNYAALPTAQSWYTGHFWSLAVEEHFYLLWPLILATFGLRRGIWVAPLSAGAVVVWRALDVKFAWIAMLDPPLRDAVGRTDYRLDGLFWGCALALVWQRPGFRAWLARIAGTPLCLGAIFGIAACVYWHPAGYLVLLPILMAILPASTAGLPSSRVGQLLEWRPLRWVGRISYSLYLWQQLFLPFEHAAWFQKLPLNVALAFLAASASYYLVERPGIAFGKRLLLPLHVNDVRAVGSGEQHAHARSD
jgi:peptidoglycan/LPS O-acetylase OafA/YrhL